MASYKKFKLKPGQKAPTGSLGVGMSDGSILFYGDDIPTEIDSTDLTLHEFKEYKRHLIMNDYNVYRQSGVGYSLESIVDYIFMYLFLTKKISQNPPNEADLQAMLDSLNPFFNWYRGLLKHKIDTLNAIESAEDFNAVELITWDFNQFTASNPGMGLI